MTVLNARRLRDYPRLMLIAIWIVLAFNLIFRQGWLGGLNQIIGSDFITLYASGLAYRTDVSHLYDLTSQFDLQKMLVQPTLLIGVNPYISPPYVAEAYSLFTHLPLQVAMIIWTLLSVGFAILAGALCFSLLPQKVSKDLSRWQLWVIIFSFFPIIEGLQVGQNHTLTLLLITSVVLFTLSDRWYLAGLMAGLLIYKPQFVIGFLVIWLIWRKYKAIGAFMVTALLWAGSSIMINGIEPYKQYLNLSRGLLLLPYIEGFPGYLLSTLYGFLATLFPSSTIPAISIISSIFAVVFLLFIAWLAYHFRNKPINETIPLIVLAILFPILAFPYSLLHDLVVLVPAFILWSRFSASRPLLYTAIGVYLGSFLLTLIDAVTKIAFLPLIPFSLTVLILLNLSSNHRVLVTGDTS